LRTTLEASLRRLGTDRIDIALIHDPDDYAAQALEGAYAALDQLRSEGTIQAVGAGMNQAPLLEWFVERADLDCVLVAGRYSLLDTAAADGLFPACQRRGVAVLAAGVFNSGILADPRPGATYDYAPAPAGLLDRAQRIGTVCARYGVPIGAAAIQFVLRHPAVTAVVVGARTATEVIEDVTYLTASVPAELFAELNTGPVGDD
jgi:aryl-alcohol dehydrogenase-like predicted oxidoreductase